MTTTGTTTSTTGTSSPATATPSAHMQKVGQIVEFAAAAAFAVGLILSAHHPAIGAFFLGSVVTFGIGWKLRKS